ncbi:hypothetical protein, partial [Streptomyces sp. NPDC005244]|uniref:hypothetical protein n=1 Tax=Streptomyces sp. NPDC005244 TaxID=3364708 RepID=UPI0036885EDF
ALLPCLYTGQLTRTRPLFEPHRPHDRIENSQSDSQIEEATSARTTPGLTQPPGLAAHDRVKAAKPPIPPRQAKKATKIEKDKKGGKVKK